MNPNTEPLYRLVGHELCQERTPHPETQIMKLTLTIEVEYDPGTTNQRDECLRDCGLTGPFPQWVRTLGTSFPGSRSFAVIVDNNIYIL